MGRYAPNITIIGTHGRNLSIYLRDYLKEQGVLSHSVGMHFKNPGTVEKIKNSHTLICLNPDVMAELEDGFALEDKTVICLDVQEVPDSSKALTGELWLEYQETYARPELVRQIKKHLKKLQK